MLQSRELVRGWRTRESLERGGDSREGCRALERGGVSPEGVTSPRARRSLTRGGDQPPREARTHPRGRPAPSEAEPHPRRRLALERGGTLPEGASNPRARRGLVSAALCPSSEVEFRSREAGADCYGGPLGRPGPWAPATEP
jgi:hypothetical protein